MVGQPPEEDPIPPGASHRVTSEPLKEEKPYHSGLNPAKGSPTQQAGLCSYVCAYNYVQLWYTVQHRTFLIIFPLILQTIITAQMVSIGGEG